MKRFLYICLEKIMLTQLSKVNIESHLNDHTDIYNVYDYLESIPGCPRHSLGLLQFTKGFEFSHTEFDYGWRYYQTLSQDKFTTEIPSGIVLYGHVPCMIDPFIKIDVVVLISDTLTIRNIVICDEHRNSFVSIRRDVLTGDVAEAVAHEDSLEVIEPVVSNPETFLYLNNLVDLLRERTGETITIDNPVVRKHSIDEALWSQYLTHSRFFDESQSNILITKNICFSLSSPSGYQGYLIVYEDSYHLFVLKPFTNLAVVDCFEIIGIHEDFDVDFRQYLTQLFSE